MLGARRARKGGRASQPRISNSHFLLAVFFRVSHDGLNERGSARSLDPKWLTCFLLLTSLNSCEFALFWSICQLVSVDLKRRTIWKKREVAPIWRILAGFFCRNPRFSSSVEPINSLFLTFMSLFCSTVLEQLKTLGETWSNSLRQNHATYRSQGLSKFVRSFAARSLIGSFARSLVVQPILFSFCWNRYVMFSCLNNSNNN